LHASIIVQPAYIFSNFKCCHVNSNANGRAAEKIKACEVILSMGPVIIYGRGEGKIKGAICINKLVERGLLNFFRKIRWGGCN
jgi:hypothetical protein